MKKKFFAKSVLMLSALLLFMCFNIQAYAADTYTSGNWTYEFTTNGLTITGYKGNETTVTIPDTLDGYKVGAIGALAFANNVTMRTVTIPETITYIGPEAFLGCAGLSQINYNAKNCTIPNVYRYDSNKGVGVFSGAGSAASSLTVTFGSKVSDIPQDLFNTDYENGYDYAHVTAIEFSSKVKTVGVHAFANCRDLETLTLGDNVTTIYNHAFYDCISLEEVTFNDELAEIGESAFEACTNLEEINWGDGLDTIGDYAFKDCTSLEEAHIPEPTSTIGRYAFINDTSLTELTIPKTVSSIGAEAFRNTIKLSQINYNAADCTIPNIWQYDSNRGVGVFSGSGSGAKKMNVTFGSEVTDIPQDLFNTDYESGYGYAHLTSITFSDGVKTVGAHAFANCRDLEEVIFGKNVTTIDEYAFYDCAVLEEVTFKDKLAEIGTSAFENCINLEKINWGAGLDSIGVTAFKGCTSLKAAHIPEPTTVIGKHAFENCTSMTALTIPATVTTIGAEAFYNTTKLAEINYNAVDCSVPGIWRHDSNSGVGVFSGAGSGAKALKVTIGTEVVKIPANLFNTDKENNYDYAYVSSVTIPANVTEIGASAFEDCMNLKTVRCDSGVASVGENVFKNCAANLVITCYYGSPIATYAAENNQTCVYLAPEKPVLGKVSNTSNGIKVTWNSSLGAAKYCVYRKTSSTGTWSEIAAVALEDGKTYYVDETVSAGKTYYYTVKAYVPDQYSEYDTTGLSIERLKAPTSLTATNKSTGIYLKWNKSTGAKKYVIYRSKSGGSYTKLYTTSNSYYTDKSATSNGTKYRYKVYAIDGDSTSVASSSKTIYRLSRPTISSLKNTASKKMTVKWKKNVSASGYEIQYATKSSFKNAKKVKATSKSTVTKTISSLKKGTKYYVRIRTYKKVSGVTYYSEWSTTKNVKITK